MAGEAVEVLPSDREIICENQTKVMVDGKAVDAYGDACLMPDGSWKRGPGKMAPR
jgi:surface antigen